MKSPIVLIFIRCLWTLHYSAQYSKQQGRSHHADVREANVYATEWATKHEWAEFVRIDLLFHILKEFTVNKLKR